MASNTPSFQTILDDIKQGRLASIYFLMGEEAYYIDSLTDYLLDHLLSEEEKEFDQLVLYGKDVTTDQVIAEAVRCPMLAPKQLVVVKEAQEIRNFEEQFLSYALHPSPTTVLVINYKSKKLDKRRKLAGVLAKTAVVYESKKLQDYELPGWIAQQVGSLKLSIDQKSCQMLADFLGNDLGRIVGEINKLKILLPEGASITPDVIEQNIGISKEFNNYELIDALMVRNSEKAQGIAHYFASNPKQHPIQLTLWVMFDFFSKLLMYHYLVDKNPSSVASQLGVYPKQVRNYEMAARHYSIRKVLDAISLIREFDARSKGFGQVALADGELLRELLARLMN